MKMIKRTKENIDRDILKGKGKARNGLCPCGSGKKLKKCHLFEYLNFKNKKEEERKHEILAKQILSSMGRDLKRMKILKFRDKRGKDPHAFTFTIEFINEAGNFEIFVLKNTHSIDRKGHWEEMVRPE